ncbi:MAG TPA: hypothetical protein VLT62_05870 [Candidatus Methylomirabilis sp.]|nr:hypothetical protein [Candidatus Methylomirabilis sp.]
MAHVLIRPAAGLPGAQRQQGLRPVQRLDPRLLIDAEHQGILRRVQVQADDVEELGLEVGIGMDR